MLIINNATIHYYQKIKQIYAKIDVKILYLFFYSFDFNSIEKFFSILKI